MEDERPRADGRVQHPLVQRIIDGVLDDRLSQPVGGVVLPEGLAGLGADHRLVQHLHDVVLDGAPREARQPTSQGADERRAAIDLDDPIEEVLLNDPADLGGREQLSAYQRGWP